MAHYRNDYVRARAIEGPGNFVMWQLIGISAIVGIYYESWGVFAMAALGFMVLIAFTWTAILLVFLLTIPWSVVFGQIGYETGGWIAAIPTTVLGFVLGISINSAGLACVRSSGT